MDIVTWTAVTVMSMYMNMSSQPTNGNFVYNAEMQDGKVSAIISYKTDMGSNLTANTKHLYEYDEQDRVICEQTLRWDAQQGQWIPAKCVEYCYNSNTVTLNYMKWDVKGGYYMAPSESVVYTIMGNMVTSVEKYKKDTKDGELRLADRYLLMGGIDNMLAGNVK